MPTPASLGFRMPAEWEPHEATWLSWPHKEESWPGNFAPIPGIFAEMVAALAPGEQVRINVGTVDLEESARAALRARGVGNHRNVRFFRVPTNDAWVRDHGPIFVVHDRGEAAITRLGLQRVGRQVSALGPRRAGPGPSRRDPRPPPLRRRDDPRRRLDRRRRPRHAPHDRGVSPQPESQSTSLARRHRTSHSRLSRRPQDPLARRRHPRRRHRRSRRRPHALRRAERPSSRSSRTIRWIRTTARSARTSSASVR